MSNKIKRITQTETLSKIKTTFSNGHVDKNENDLLKLTLVERRSCASLVASWNKTKESSYAFTVIGSITLKS